MPNLSQVLSSSRQSAAQLFALTHAGPQSVELVWRIQGLPWPDGALSHPKVFTIGLRNVNADALNPTPAFQTRSWQFGSSVLL